MYQQGDVTDIVPAASVKVFSSIHKAQSLLYVLSVEMETSSESDLHASPVRLSLSLFIILHGLDIVDKKTSNQSMYLLT